MPKNCVLVFGQEGPGLSDEMIKASAKILQLRNMGQQDQSTLESQVV